MPDCVEPDPPLRAARDLVSRNTGSARRVVVAEADGRGLEDHVEPGVLRFYIWHNDDCQTAGTSRKKACPEGRSLQGYPSQPGAQENGIHEVMGSIPISSTNSSNNLAGSH